LREQASHLRCDDFEDLITNERTKTCLL